MCWRVKPEKIMELKLSNSTKNLVIVESPAKARTLGRILGSKYNLKASMGHIRDLPKSRLGVDIEHDFEPKYVVPRTKAKTVKELKEAGNKAGTIYLATDPDREGEAIAWHLTTQIQQDNVPFKRVVFHEITEEAVLEAFKHPRAVDMHLVDAQQARRVLDRLVGYKLSPLLWQKVRRGLSAGRVQSVALRIIVDREREIEKFVPEEYWTMEAELAAKAAHFRAQLVSFADGTKLAINNRQKSDTLKSKLQDAKWTIEKVKTKKVLRQPAPPFITSTLQQEAWYKLRFSAEQTMTLAQQLYEGLPIGKEESVGLITYMRTDSTNVAHSAVAETREFISEKYGADYMPPHARVFTRVVRGAQEAHEAIRPTKIHRTPESVKSSLSLNQFKLYQLIWNRMVASQMSAAVYDNTTVDIEAKCGTPNDAYLFRASSSVNRFPGFTVLYSREEGKTDEDTGKNPLPPLSKGELLKLIELFSEQRFTQPPSRFTEASLIRMLEERGIGRPSTYASIMLAIKGREYVTKTNGIFKPTELGITVTDLLVQNFGDIVDIDFTAHMEDDLDEIAQKKKVWVDVVKEFYTPFESDLKKASADIVKVAVPVELTDEKCDKCGKPMAIKIGRFGKFLACTGYPECKTTRSFQVKTGVKCPECGSELVQRFNKKRQIFYGCSAYPKCTFAANAKPLPQPCPACGGLLVEYKEGKAKCTKCSFRGKPDGRKEETAVTVGAVEE
jgi:DNA topoisomerase I